MNSPALLAVDQRTSQQPYEGEDKRNRDEIDIELDKSLKEVRRLNREIRESNEQRKMVKEAQDIIGGYGEEGT